MRILGHSELCIIHCAILVSLTLIILYKINWITELVKHGSDHWLFRASLGQEACMLMDLIFCFRWLTTGRKGSRQRQRSGQRQRRWARFRSCFALRLELFRISFKSVFKVQLLLDIAVVLR